MIPKKSLGQNFLNNEKILNQIIKYGNINEEDTILEIGPGTGKLTEKIIELQPAKLIVVEKDKKLSQELNKISPWYNKHITNFSGKDGTDLTIKFLKDSSNYLEKKGFIIFPIISLSNHKKVLTFTKKKFKFVKRIQSKEWPLPKEMYKYKKKIEFLSKKKLIFVKKKFGLILFKTDIYLVKKNG